MKKQNVNRDVEQLYVMKETLDCQKSGCIACAYKIIINTGEYGTLCAQNVRPEECFRIKQDQKHNNNKNIGILRSDQKILTVGDGDFSFTLSLARAFAKKPNKHYLNLIGTSHESRHTLLEVYPNIQQTFDELNDRGVTLYHDIDATKLEQYSQIQDDFDQIIWNFPCIARGIEPGEDGQTKNIQENKQLIKEFCQSAKQKLSKNGQILITHKISPPFSFWNIIELGISENTLYYNGSIIFDKCVYKPYNNRKALDKKSFPIFDAQTYIFSKQDKNLNEYKELLPVSLDLMDQIRKNLIGQKNTQGKKKQNINKKFHDEEIIHKKVKLEPKFYKGMISDFKQKK